MHTCAFHEEDDVLARFIVRNLSIVAALFHRVKMSLEAAARIALHTWAIGI